MIWEKNCCVISKPLTLASVKSLFSLENAVPGLCFAVLYLTRLNYTRLSTPADSLMFPLTAGLPAANNAGTVPGLTTSLSGLILQIDPSSAIATVTVPFRL